MTKRLFSVIRYGVLKILLFLISLYQYGLSPVLYPCCRYTPSCSRYMQQALQRHGLWAGLWMGGLRLLRCHPWAKWGFDEVPEQLPPRAKWYTPWRYGGQERNKDKGIRDKLFERS